jgi:hypothetical protein
MASKKFAALNGPIPGENLISDERNYPWHRPPDFDNLNDAMEFLIEAISEKPKLFGVLNVLENEITVAELSQALVMASMMEGRFTMDFALLLAGPLTKYISILAEGYEIDYDVGIKESYQYYPKELVEAADEDYETQRISSLKDEDEVEDVNEDVRVGLMEAMREDTGEVAPAEEQEEMLGYTTEEEELV